MYKALPESCNQSFNDLDQIPGHFIATSCVKELLKEGREDLEIAPLHTFVEQNIRSYFQNKWQ